MVSAWLLMSRRLQTLPPRSAPRRQAPNRPSRWGILSLAARVEHDHLFSGERAVVVQARVCCHQSWTATTASGALRQHGCSTRPGTWTFSSCQASVAMKAAWVVVLLRLLVFFCCSLVGRVLCW